MSYASEVLVDAPSAYYRLAEASGQPQDSSGNARHTTATVSTNATYHQTSAIGTDLSDFSIDFNTATGFTTPDVGLDLGDVFTIEAWVKLAAITNFDDRYIVTKGVNAYSLLIELNGTPALAAPTVGYVLPGNRLWPDTTSFHHLVATKSGGTAKLYLDAVDISGTYVPNTFADTAETLHLGCSRTGDAFSCATIDEIAIYPTALTQTRVQTHYNAAVSSLSAPSILAIEWLRA